MGKLVYMLVSWLCKHSKTDSKLCLALGIGIIGRVS